MDLAKVLQELHEELANLDAAISSLERLQETSKQRTRESEWPTSIAPPVRAVRKRKNRVGAPGAEAGGQDSEAGESGGEAS